MRFFYSVIGILGFALILVGCSTQKNELPPSSNSAHILIDQVGYYPNSPKKALVRSGEGAFNVKTTEGAVVLEGKLSSLVYWPQSGDSVAVADFSSLKEGGTYVICVNDTACSYPFRIDDSLYQDLANASLKSYYYARCSEEITPAYGGKWIRPAGHADTAVVIHTSAADDNRQAGDIISSPGGWYDAGDFGKYIVNSSITTWTLLQSLSTNTSFHQSQNLVIPESSNELPDILDEALVNLKWMLTMQDPHDGGVYHKLTTKNFERFIMPHESELSRYAVQKSTAASLDFAATMAKASRVMEHYKLTELAEQMRESAQLAWEWALTNPTVYYQQPEDISTGAYDDNSLQDEWFWAASELYLLTSEESFKERMMETYMRPVTPKWNVVHTLGIISVITEQEIAFENFKQEFLSFTDNLVAKGESCPYLISTNEFAWGSNSDIANDGMLKLIAFELTKNNRYFNSALEDLHYILGRNTTGFSFVTGFGHKTPQNQHNRIMAADGIDEPIPGYISGGPNTVVLNDCEPESVERSKYPAASYVDVQCSYSTNETAINWNAPLVFLTSGLQQNVTTSSN